MNRSDHEGDRPKLLGDPAAKAVRITLLREPHIAPLTDFVDELRHEAGPGAAVPDFDPWDAGVAAEVLFLLEAPGAKAVASTFVSRNNPDETAKNMFELNRDAGIARTRSLLWNAVPWYIGEEDRTRIRAATAADLERGLEPLPRLIGMLPNLRAVVFMGEKAQRAREQVEQLRPDLVLFSSPHPSPLFVNNRPGNRDIILGVLREVAKYLDDSPGAAPMPIASANTCPAVSDKPQPETVAGCVSAVLQSLSVLAQQPQEAGETLSPCFASEIAALRKALELLGVAPK
ncbi:uracil-DNA glycosylase [Burkholderia sp. JPY481]